MKYYIQKKILISTYNRPVRPVNHTGSVALKFGLVQCKASVYYLHQVISYLESLENYNHTCHHEHQLEEEAIEWGNFY